MDSIINRNGQIRQNGLKFKNYQMLIKTYILKTLNKYFDEKYFRLLRNPSLRYSQKMKQSINFFNSFV